MKKYFRLGFNVLNTGHGIIEEDGSIGYGIYGRYVLDNENVEIGFEAEEKQYSYGWQSDGSFIKNGVKIENVYFVFEKMYKDSFDYFQNFKGTYKQAISFSGQSKNPCYVIKAKEDFDFENGTRKEQPSIKFTNKAWRDQ